MELALAPPSRILAGIKLGAPLVVTFQASKLKRRPASESDKDLSGVWAYVCLVNEDQSRILAPPRTDLLHGEPAASIYPLPESTGPFAYAVFPGLAITTPGRYCFRINIIDMNRCVPRALVLAANSRSVRPAHRPPNCCQVFTRTPLMLSTMRGRHRKVRSISLAGLLLTRG